jgi:hypothetical protein
MAFAIAFGLLPLANALPSFNKSSGSFFVFEQLE